MPRLAAVLCLSLSVTLACWAQDPEPREGGDRSYPDKVVAIVDGTPVTRYELELACLLRGDYRELTPGSTAQQRILREELEVLIEQRVLVNKAGSEKIEFGERDEARLQVELKRHSQRYGGLDGLKRALEAVGVPFDYFVARQKANILVSKLLVRSIPRDLFVSPQEIRRHYQRNLSKYSRKGVTRLRQIVVYPDPADSVREKVPALERLEEGTFDAKTYAEELRARIAKGEDFAKVALDASLGPKFDEEVVVRSTHSLDDVFIRPLGERIQSMRPGELSEVIETVRGSYWLILLIDRREPGPLPLEEVQREIEIELKEVAWQKKLKLWIDAQRKQATVRTYL